jgi:transposase
MDCFIGIDVSKATLDIACRPDGESWTVTNDAPGLAELTPRLLGRASALVVVVVNPTPHPPGRGCLPRGRTTSSS